jgi:hypothetical protein
MFALHPLGGGQWAGGTRKGATIRTIEDLEGVESLLRSCKGSMVLSETMFAQRDQHSPHMGPRICSVRFPVSAIGVVKRTDHR